MSSHGTLLFLVTEDWYFASHRLPLARRAVEVGYRVFVATRVQAHADVIRNAGCELIPLPWRRRGSTPWSEVRALGRLVHLYRTIRPDIVHHVALKPVVYGSLAAALTGIPAVVNAVAGMGYVFIGADGRARLLRPALRIALRAALRGSKSWAVLQNPDDRELLVAGHFVQPDRVVLIRGSGVDLATFTPATPPTGPCTVVFVGRMLWHKGVGEFVDAARRLRSAGVGARFVLVGDTDPGNPAAVDAEQLAAWQVSGIVEWWGHRTDMPAVLAASHVACLPSYREGLPKALIEAAAAGRPIVATDVPGCREVVRSEENGLLVPVRDSEALAAGLHRLIDDPGLRARMGARGRAMAEAEFSIERVVGETLELYRRIAP